MATNLEILKANCHDYPFSTYAKMLAYSEQDGKGVFGKKVDFSIFSDPQVANEFISNMDNKLIHQYIVNLFEIKPLDEHFGRFFKSFGKVGDIENYITAKLQSVVDYDSDKSPTNPFEVSKPTIVQTYIKTTDKSMVSVTLNYEQWYGAFTTEGGLQNLANLILSMLNDAIDLDIYDLVLKDLSDTTQCKSVEVSKIDETSEDTLTASTKKFYTDVLMLRNSLHLPSKTGEYNKSGLETTGTPYKNMVLYLNNKYATNSMVRVLASLFKSEKIDLTWDVVEFPSTATGVIGVLMDERAYVIAPRINFTQSIVNPRNMCINTYHHKWFKRGFVPFYNAVILKEKA